MIDKSIGASAEQKRETLPPPVYEERSARTEGESMPQPMTMEPPKGSQSIMLQNRAPSGQQPAHTLVPQPFPAPDQQNKTPAQIGEEYRAALYAQCAMGIHSVKRSYGPCGIITAVFLFPVGLICLFTDSEKKCDRCGVKLK